MKVCIEQENKVFKPVTVTFKIENQIELEAMRRLFNTGDVNFLNAVNWGKYDQDDPDLSIDDVSFKDVIWGAINQYKL